MWENVLPIETVAVGYESDRLVNTVVPEHLASIVSARLLNYLSFHQQLCVCVNWVCST